MWLVGDTGPGRKSGTSAETSPPAILQQLRAHLEHVLRAVPSPPHLLALDHSAADHLIHGRFRRRGRDRHPVGEHQESWGVWLGRDTARGRNSGYQRRNVASSDAIQHLRAHLEHVLRAVASSSAFVAA